MRRKVITLVLLFLYGFGVSKNLYEILGVEKFSTAVEIKRAYRLKARDTHPDKRRDIDAEEASIAFRDVVEAYEVLSDAILREEYNRNGERGGATTSRDAKRNHQDNDGPFHFFRNNQYFSDGIRQHPYLFSPFRRKQILDAQRRVINIRPDLNRLSATVIDDEEAESDTVFMKRYVLLAFFDSRSTSCVNILHAQSLFPWPFAGFTNDGNSGMWWDEYLMAIQVDMADARSSLEERAKFAKYFGLRFTVDNQGEERLAKEQCPSFLLLSRGQTLHQEGYHNVAINNHEEFSSWVWGQLKMNVRFINKIPWILRVFWIDGFRGIESDNLGVEEIATMSTFISHTFSFQANFVTGNALNNESSLLIYTARVQDDGSAISAITIRPRCFDHDTNCLRWRQEGFCDPHRETFYPRQNPSFKEYVKRLCFASCKVGCGASRSTTDEL